MPMCRRFVTRGLDSAVAGALWSYEAQRLTEEGTRIEQEPREPSGATEAPAGSGGEGGDAIIGAALEGLRRAAHEVEVERSVTATLQHSLLREKLPEIPGMSFAARYLPGSAEAEIGGDWYDVIPLRDGKAGIAIGDVVGRGIGAAARMAHLQSAVRAYALEGLRPSVVLERTDAFAQELERRGMATLLYAVLDPEAGTLRFASAGHPPPLIVAPAGEVVFAEGRSGSPLGTVTFPSYEESVVALEPGSLVVLYTDGLVERPTVPLSDGLVALAEAASGLHEPQDLCQALPGRVLEGRSADDIALLATRLDPVADDLIELSLGAESRSLATLRRVLGRWLKSAGAGETEIYETLVAVGEACANAIAHAYPAGDASFDVRGSRLGPDLEITVRDFGRWRPARGEERRRGLTLMEQLMEEVEIDKGQDGTTVVLRRSLKNGAAA
jgi:anti-sigma regulatory factor (Ser/Thr protein kinase)